MHVAQQLDVEAVIGAQALEQLRHGVEVLRCRPHGFQRELAFGGLVAVLAVRDAVSLRKSRHAALSANGLVAQLDVATDFRAGLGDVAPVGVTVDERAFARAAAEQLIERQAGHFSEDVPQRDVDRCDSRHRDGPAAPVRASIEELKRVLDAAGITPDEIGDHVIGEIRRDRELATVQRRIADAVDAGARLDLERDEVGRPGQVMTMTRAETISRSRAEP